MSFVNTTLKQYFPPIRTLLLLILVQLGAAALLSFAVVEHPLLVLLVICAIPMALAAVVWPETITLVVFFMMYSNAAAVIVQFHGVPFVVGAAVPLMLVVPLANYVFLHHEKLVFHPLMLLVGLFHFVQLLGTIFSKDVPSAMPNLIEHLVEGIVFYFLIVNTVRTPNMLRYVIWILLVSGAFLGVLGFYQVITHTYDKNYGGFAQVSAAAFKTGDQTLQGEVTQPRLAGSVGEQNRHAQILLMLVPLGIFLLRIERSYFLRGLIVGMTALSALGVATTFSRGAAVAFVIILMVMVFMRYITVFQLVAVGVGLILLLTIVLPQYATRLVSLQGVLGLVSEDESTTAEAGPDHSLQNRSVEMYAAALVFADHPIVGVGPDMFHSYYADYVQLAGDNSYFAGTRQAHNLYLSIAANHGLLGLIAFLVVIYFTLRWLAQARKQLATHDPMLANIATGFILAITSYLATGIGLHFGFARFFWLIMALACATVQIAQREMQALHAQGEQSAHLLSPIRREGQVLGVAR